MALKNTFLPTAVLIISAMAIHGKFADAENSPFCSQTVPGEEMDLCNTLVNGAKTWDAAMTNVIEASMKVAEPVKPTIAGLSSILPDALHEDSKSSLTKTCEDSLDSLSENYNKVLKNLKTGDPYQSIETQLSAAAASLSDCTDGLDEFGADSPHIRDVKDAVQKYASLSLAVAYSKPK